MFIHFIDQEHFPHLVSHNRLTNILMLKNMATMCLVKGYDLQNY